MYPQNDGPIYTKANEADANFGLKPYIYYSCRYNNGSVDFVLQSTVSLAL